MTQATFHDTENLPNRPVGTSRQQSRTISVIIHVAQSLWPTKTAPELAARSGVSTRTCERWIADNSGISADALASLLRSDDGFKFLEALIGDARPAWWRGFKTRVQIAELRRQQQLQQETIERLERQLAE